MSCQIMVRVTVWHYWVVYIEQSVEDHGYLITEGMELDEGSRGQETNGKMQQQQQQQQQQDSVVGFSKWVAAGG